MIEKYLRHSEITSRRKMMFYRKALKGRTRLLRLMNIQLYLYIPIFLGIANWMFGIPGRELYRVILEAMAILTSMSILLPPRFVYFAHFIVGTKENIRGGNVFVRYAYIFLAFRSVIFNREFSRRAVLILSSVLSCLFMTFSILAEINDREITIRNDANFILHVWILFQLYIDNLFYSFVKEREMNYLKELRRRTKLKNIEKKRFIRLFSHTSKNTVSGILPYLSEMKEEFLRKDSPVPRNSSFFRTGMQKFGQIEVNAKLINSGISNLMNFEMNVQKNFQTEDKRFDMNRLLERFNTKIRRSLWVAKRVELKTRSSEKSQPCLCFGDESLIFQMMENLTWRFLARKKIVSSSVSLHSFYDRLGKELFFELELSEKSTPNDSSSSTCNSFTTNQIITDTTNQIITEKLGGIVEENESSTRAIIPLALASPIPSTSTCPVPDVLPSPPYASMVGRQSISSSLPFSRLIRNHNDDPNDRLEIMVIDDLKICRMAITNMIRRTGKDHKYVEFEDGFEALVFLLRRIFHPDVIFVDYNMEKMRGDEFSRAVVANNLIIKPWCDIFLVSGGSFQKKSEVCKKNYFTNIISKPVNFKTVQETLENTVIRREKMIAHYRNESSLLLSSNNGDSNRIIEEEEEEEGEGEIQNHHEEEDEKSTQHHHQKKKNTEKKHVNSPSFLERLLESSKRNTFEDIFLVSILSLFVLIKRVIFMEDPHPTTTTTTIPLVVTYLLVCIFSNTFLSYFIRSRQYLWIVSDVVRGTYGVFFFPTVRMFLFLGFTKSSHYLMDVKFKKQVFVVTVLLLYFLLIEIYLFWSKRIHHHQETTTTPTVVGLLSVCEFIFVVFLVKSTQKMSETKEKREREMNESLMKYLDVEKQIHSMIRFSSETFRKHLYFVEFFILSLKPEIRRFPFKPIELPPKVDEYKSIVRNSVVNFKKDQFNLLLVNCMLSDHRTELKDSNHQVTKSKKQSILRLVGNFFGRKSRVTQEHNLKIASKPSFFNVCKRIGNLPIRMTTFLGEVVEEEQIKSLQYSKYLHQNEVKVDLLLPQQQINEEEEVFYDVDSYSLYIIFVNLIQNAFQYTKNGVISIHASLEKKKSEEEEEEVDILNFSVENKFRIRGGEESNKNKHVEDLTVLSNRYNCFEKNVEDYTSENRVFEVITERGVKAGEELGNPKLGLGHLVIQKLISTDFVPNGKISISVEEKDEIIDNISTPTPTNYKMKEVTVNVQFLCDNMRRIPINKKEESSEEKRRVLLGKKNVLLVCGSDPVFSSCVKETLQELGLDERNVNAVGSREEMKPLKKKIYDICVFGEANFCEEVEEILLDRYTLLSEKCFFIFSSRNVFGQQGLLSLEGSCNRRFFGVNCLEYFGKFELKCCLEYYIGYCV